MLRIVEEAEPGCEAVPERNHAIREDFPVLRRQVDGQPVCYLDSAATSLKPQSVIDAVVGYYSECSANIHRGHHLLSEEASTVFERVRYDVGQFLGVPSNEVVFVHSATHGLNMLASSIALEPSDCVVSLSASHHSNLVPWRRSVAKHIEVPFDLEGNVDMQIFRRFLEERPKVVALTHCSNVTGMLAPVSEMAAEAKEAGAVVVLDAAQSAPHGLLDLGELDVDFAVFSGHKMLAPTGVGVLWGRMSCLELLEPVEFGGGTLDWVDDSSDMLRKIPHRFEAGTPNIAGVYGLGAAISYLQRIGQPYLQQHDAQCARYLMDRVAERDYLTLVGSAERPRCAVASLRVDGLDKLDDVARVLSDSYGIMCRTGHLCAQPLVERIAGGPVLRISPYLYNTENELAFTFDALDRVVSALR